MEKTIDYPRGITFEQVWAGLQESKLNFEKEMKESRERFEREMKESRLEWDQKMEERRIESDRKAEERRIESDRETEESRIESEKKKKEADKWLKEMKQLQKETAQLIKETDQLQKETAQQMKETDKQMKETDKQMQKTDRKLEKIGIQIGDLGGRFGELAEHLVAPGVVEKFNEIGFHFDSVATRGMTIYDTKGKPKTEIDLFLENTEYIVAVEVKSKPKEKDIEHHIKRLEILKEYRERKQEKPKKIMGAIAGAIFDIDVKKATVNTGFYVLEQSGDTRRMNMPENFTPRVG
jgi:hypothetical protein